MVFGCALCELLEALQNFKPVFIREVREQFHNVVEC